ncbi:MAG: type III secretion system export apparatus subunit SctT [Alphaproteobacteria bacterium]|nr:type III secretion system export apparatus subunit SctT [Alphaproteobacteria bacterium]MDA7983027.1 type III secretion system export apparatus subunit SctT [Alphaproteobacteria bacterium]MDA7984170.1 type III secretion system export apparatus subunit SctT [Alphaproteobacteria bacterium]MDA7987048.1 type III secretion system export apparatus subunit SctT [Alphaproteobacteria bacterium]MDA7988657.1 type III secretion system export apparatus subunit SctT [Alphaproteobacteria bacterium]
MPEAVETEIAAWTTALLLVLPRAAGFFLFLPFFSNQVLPAIAKFSLFTVLVIPALPHGRASLAEYAADIGPLSASVLILLLLKESLLGIVVGFATALVFRVPGMIGDFIDNQRGTSIAQVFNPAQGDQSSNLGAFLGQVFIVWFLLSGGLTSLLALLYESYRVLPPASFLPRFGRESLDALVAVFIATLHLLVVLAAPMIFIMMLVDIALGLANRFAPQLNVFFLAMPIKSVVALFALSLYLAIALRHLGEVNLTEEPLRRLLEIGAR